MEQNYKTEAVKKIWEIDPDFDLEAKLPFPLTNDYLFIMLLQENPNALRELTASLLHVDPSSIEIEITNPIIRGSHIDSKTFILDLKCKLKNGSIINFEMQVSNQGNWPERTLSYLCRSFDTLNKGEDYINVHQVRHIGFLDFDPFPGYEFFYTTNKLSDENNHIYTDKFMLSMVQLRHIDKATEEDKKYKIDQWARLFKATTWKELKKLAETWTVMNDTVSTIQTLLADSDVIEEARRRQDYLDHEARVARERLDFLVHKERMEKELKELKEQEARMEKEYKELENKYKQAQKSIVELEQQLAAK